MPGVKSLVLYNHGLYNVNKKLTIFKQKLWKICFGILKPMASLERLV